jgi:NAD(P)-dependent dehydrogenase (short-subunit alcohol dehydrogenase family)
VTFMETKRNFSLTICITLVLLKCCIAFQHGHLSASSKKFVLQKEGRFWSKISSRPSPIWDSATTIANGSLEGTTTCLNIVSRRGAMLDTCKQAASVLFLLQGASIPANAAERPEVVAIIGGNGRTGKAVAETLAKAGINAVTLTRSGKDPYQVIKLAESVKANLSHYDSPVDVRDVAALAKAVADVKATTIVFAASASRQGGNSFEVDAQGVANAAQVAKDAKAKLIIISSIAVDRPDSKSFQMTNSLGSYVDKIMDAKLLGEQKAIEIMGKGGNYVIIRPGVLMSVKSRGATDIELNQGDMVGGGIGRDELAGVVLGAIQSDKARGVTVEAYRKVTRTKLQPDFATTSGNELTAETYEGLFADVK